MSRPARVAVSLLAALAVGAISAEISARAFWMSRGLSFLACQNQIHLFFYPELRPVERLVASRDDGYFDVLLLGASTLMIDYAPIEPLLHQRLLAAGVPARIHNVAFEGHSSLDSLHKYRRLRDKRFDLVIVYDGVNETRANNVPPGAFRDDYAHYSWYRIVNDWEGGGGSRVLVFPFTLRMLRTKAEERLGLRAYVPLHEPGPAWVRYGGMVRTGGPFRKNLSAILELAATKGERVVLMTVAHYLPKQYPDVPAWWFPVEGWGRPEHVVRGVETHNDVIRSLAAGRDVIFVDQAARLPPEPAFFRDLCHLTPEGSWLFVENIMAELCSRRVVCAAVPR